MENMSDISIKYRKMSKVNLDALIQREDFTVIDRSQNSSPNLDNISIRDLEKSSFFYVSLKKPDFQRETSDWTPEKICDLIQCFLNDDLIPSIILWSSGNSNFVIDGAHRLSALIAWVMDDYGDGHISKSFFGFELPSAQIKLADKTRKLIKKRIGSYQEHKLSVENPDKADKKILESAHKMSRLAVQLQWVKGNSSKAEDAFFKINESATPINDTEKLLLRSRNKPNAIAARAIIHSGTGHKYWSKFATQRQDEIASLAKDINDILFEPEIKNPIKTLDLPLGGKGYSSQTLSLIFDLVNISNEVKLEKLENDETGEETIKFLKRTKKLLSRITGTDPSSLGLHPAVYFYSISGRYQVTALLAIIELIKTMENEKDAYRDFITIRPQFELFLINYKTLINQTVTHLGSGLKSYLKLQKFFKYIINSFETLKTEEKVIEALKLNKEYSYLRPEKNEIEFTTNKDFSDAVKSATFITEALKSAIKCKVCDGYMHVNSITIDHKERKREGGLGNLSNAQLAHPYCNTTVKN